MKIHWSSETAQEVLERLRRADRGLSDSERQVKLIRATLADANPDGEEKALTLIAEKFDECVKGLEALERDLELYRRALQRTDEMFDDAERSLLQICRNLDSASQAPASLMGDGVAVNWQPAAFAPMPEMRVRATPAPRWLEMAADALGAL